MKAETCVDLIRDKGMSVSKNMSNHSFGKKTYKLVKKLALLEAVDFI